MPNQRNKPKPNQLQKAEVYFNKFKKTSSFLMVFYLIYLGKSALGINLLADYTAPQFLKIPFQTMDCLLPIEGNYCYKS